MDKLKLLEITFQKLSSDPGFVAHYLSRYAALHQRPAGDLMRALDCTAENYYKLALCKAPEPGRADFSERLARIAGYAGVSLAELTRMMREVHAAQHAPAIRIPLPAFLSRWLERLANIPAPGFAFGRSGLSFLSLVFFVGVFVAKVDTHHKQHYQSNAQYRDSVQHLCLADQTRVDSSF